MALCVLFIIFATVLVTIPLRVTGTTVCLDAATRTLSATRSDSCTPPETPYYSVQLNIFDAWWEWAGVDSIDGPVNASLARQAITDALLNDFTIYRFFGYLYGTSMELWRDNTTYFWSMYDAYYSFISTLNNNQSSANKIYLIPSLGYQQWYELTDNETLHDLVTNNQSQSRQLMYQYLHEYITRYQELECILFWELGNELNLDADLPNKPESETFSTPQMVQYVQEIVNFIRQIDDRRPISSGYGCARPQAWHLYYNQSWQIDSVQQWSAMLSWQNQPVDIISCHAYGDEAFFSASADPQSTDVFYVAANVSMSEGKLFYVGEFGPPGLDYTNASATLFVYNVMNAMVDVHAKSASSSWMLSTIWAWEDYTHGNNLLYPNRTSSIPVINAMHSATNKMNVNQ